MGVRIMVGRRFTRAFGASLMGGASFLALAGTADAQTVLFSSNDAIRKGPLEAGREQVVSSGTVQIKLASGAVASFVNSAQFSVRDDGGIDLRSGSVTVVGTGGPVAVHMPEGVKGTLQGAGTASFSVGTTGSRGSTTAGKVAITANGVTNIYSAGQFWSAVTGKSPDRVVAGVAAAVPEAGSVQPMREGGPAAVAANGLPIALGEALAGAGASGDLIAAARRVEAYDANPTIGAFPSGDYAALIGYAAAAANQFGAGGRAFNGAQADIIRTYFEYLAAGNAGANFRTAYAAVLVNYLDLVRSGVLPSSFRGATQAQLGAYIAFIGRTDGFAGLTPANRQLLDAYLAFLSTNGTPDQFGTSVSNLTTAFLNYVRGGGNPAAFTQASASVVAQYLAIVNSGGLKTNLNAQNQALLAAYLANNGVAFSNSYATGLAQFVAYLNTGGLPSNYTAVPAATLRTYLETLETTGLFDRLLGTQAAFLRSYLGFLRTGGTPDQFNALPINVARVNAASLSAYVDYLLAGGAPTAYADLTQAQIRAALDQLTAVGQFDTLLGVNSGFLGEYYAYIATGADPDAFAGLPTVDVNAYAAVLSSFAAYLRGGNLPSNYATLTAQQVRSYLTALQFSGNITLLGSNATLLGDYLAYLRSGGVPDNFSGLPIYTYQGYASALAAYFAHLNAGGLPSGYSALTQTQLRDYLAALQANGQFTLLGANSGFYTDYLAYLTGGGTIDGFASLPIVAYQGYASALAAYFAHLNAGGLPSGYNQLSQAQIRAYLDALSANSTLTALLGGNAAFFQAYYAFLAGGGLPNDYPGLPSSTYGQYAAALNAYFAYLAAGNLPSGYSALTAQQIQQYLDVLQGNGQIAALLGANATFYSNYLAYITGGGSPDAFTGLPIVTYQGYAAALGAYHAYLAGGGLPANYSALTQAQIRAYLDALNAAGQIAALLGANATFFSNYLAYVASGGNPATYNQLPANIYASYGSALVNFVAYLRGNGLPASYSALTAIQIREYLAVLQANGQLSLIGNQSDIALVNAYASFLAGGGVPNQFPGLPAFVTYEAALRAYYTYLQGGGLPSAYSTLTQAQVVAYFQALDAAGLIAANLSAQEAQFVRSYVAWVTGGNAPDQFAGLPGNLPPAPPVVTPGLASAPVSNVATAASGKNLFSAATTGRTVTLDSGNVSQVGGTRTVTNKTAQTVEAKTVDNVIAIARWTGGQFNTDSANNAVGADQGVHFVWGAPATTMPGSGSATFGLVAATSPTRDGGGVAPGTFTGNLGVNFTTRRVGWDSVISLDGVNYRFASDGGVTMPTVAIQGTTFNGTASTDNNGLAGSGSGFFSGTNAGLIGFAYMAQGPGANGEIQGTAIFGRNAPAVTLPTVNYPPVINPLPSPGYSYAGGFTPSGSSIYRAISASASRNSANNGVQIQIGTDGKVTQLASLVRASNSNIVDVAGTASAIVGRWTGPGTSYFVGSQASTFTGAQSLHYYAMAPIAFTKPSSGLVNFTMTAATQPTYGSGYGAAGLFDAQFAIDFSTNRAGMQGMITMPDANGNQVYSFSTSGGVAAPGVNLFAWNLDSLSFSAAMTGAGRGCGNSCSLSVQGSFGGGNVNALGIVYNSTGGNVTDAIYGAATFAGDAIVPGTPVIVPMPAAFANSYRGSPGAGITRLVGGADTASMAFAASTGGNNAGVTRDEGTGAATEISESSIGIYRRVTAVQADVAGDGTYLIGRWTDGTIRSGGGSEQFLVTRTLGANDGLHYAVRFPGTRTLPTTGTITYNLIGATAPTLYGGSPGSAAAAVAPGVFDARIAVAYGNTPKIGIEGAIYMAETSAGANKYSFASTGGLAAPSATIGSGGFGFTAPVSGGGLACPAGASTCTISLEGGYAGYGTDRIALTYIANNNSGNGVFIHGAAAFGAAGTETHSQLVNQSTHVFANGTRVDRADYVATYDGANLLSYSRTNTGVAVAAGSTVQDSGRLASTIGWARWTGDTAGPLTNQGPNAGVHVLSGTQAPNADMPASGIVNYTLAGGTRPTLADGSAAPGTITGSLAVSFAAVTSRVGFDITATVGGYGWRMQTQGGTANPSVGISNTDRTFVASFAKGTTLTGTTAQSCVGTCSADAYGGLYGTAASHVGLGFGISDGAVRANGVAVFAKTP